MCWGRVVILSKGHGGIATVLDMLFQRSLSWSVLKGIAI